MNDGSELFFKQMLLLNYNQFKLKVLRTMKLTGL